MQETRCADAADLLFSFQRASVSAAAVGSLVRCVPDGIPAGTSPRISIAVVIPRTIIRIARVTGVTRVCRISSTVRHSPASLTQSTTAEDTAMTPYGHARRTGLAARNTARITARDAIDGFAFRTFRIARNARHRSTLRAARFTKRNRSPV